MTYIPKNTAAFNPNRDINPRHYWTSNFGVSSSAGNVQLWLDQGHASGSVKVDWKGAVSGTNPPEYIESYASASGNPAVFFESTNSERLDDGNGGINFDFIHQETDCTVIVVFDSIDNGTARPLIGNTAATNEHGWYASVRNDFGEGVWLSRGVSGAGNVSLALTRDIDHIAKQSVMVFRKTVRASNDTGWGGTPTGQSVAELRVDGQVVAYETVYPNAPSSNAGSRTTAIGFINGFADYFNGAIFEILIDDRWVPDDLIIKYEEYAKKKYNLQTVRGFTRVV